MLSFNIISVGIVIVIGAIVAVANGGCCYCQFQLDFAFVFTWFAICYGLIDYAAIIYLWLLIGCWFQCSLMTLIGSNLLLCDFEKPLDPQMLITV